MKNAVKEMCGYKRVTHAVKTKLSRRLVLWELAELSIVYCSVFNLVGWVGWKFKPWSVVEEKHYANIHNTKAFQ